MARQLWSQDNFSRGELSPSLYPRVTLKAYYNGLRVARNVIGTPQGGMRKRFGTLFCSEFTAIESANENYLFFETWVYEGSCCYQVCAVRGKIYILLEGIAIADLTVADLEDFTVSNLSTTSIDDAFVVCGESNDGKFKPKLIKRAAPSSHAITGLSFGVDGTSFLQVGGVIASDVIYPVRFTGTTLPSSMPQLTRGVDYFVKTFAGNLAQVFQTSKDAARGENSIAFTDIGSSATLQVFSQFSITNLNYRKRPVHDFDTQAGNGYEAVTFTPSAASGAAVTITTSGGSPFKASHKDGVFFGNGGSAFITAVNSSSSITVAVSEPFRNTSPISGTVAYLAEPVWSDDRGWPTRCSSFQSRLFLANTRTFKSGVWGSATRDYSTFYELEPDDSSPVGAFAHTGSSSEVKYIVPYRSLTVHTTVGMLSTPIDYDQVVTPDNFALTLQDKAPASVLKPVAIDNQIIFAVNNDVCSMEWSSSSASYQSSICSIMSNHLIKNPVDCDGFMYATRAGSKYVFIVNGDGTLASYQTQIKEDIAGWTAFDLKQSKGNAKFLRCATDEAGRLWFLTRRQIEVGGNLVWKYFVEEFSDQVYLDCATRINLNATTNHIVGLERFNGQQVKATGDGFGFSGTVENGRFDFVSNGQEFFVSDLAVGFPIQTRIETLPVSLATTQNVNSSNITTPKHAVTTRLTFVDTIGGAVNGTPIAINKLMQTNLGSPPAPQTGLFELAPMRGWDAFNTPTLTIEHSDPFDMQLTGIFYTMDS